MPRARRAVLYCDQYITGNHVPFFFPTDGEWHAFRGPALNLPMDERGRATSQCSVISRVTLHLDQAMIECAVFVSFLTILLSLTLLAYDTSRGANKAREGSKH